MRDVNYADIIFQIILSRSKSQSNIQISQNHIIDLIHNTTILLHKEDPIIKLNGEFHIIGDLHGDINSLLRIFIKNGYPDKHKYVFLGDYIDRGENSLEVLIFLFCLKCVNPDSLYLLKGNHESPSLSSLYGFKDECNNRYSNVLYEKFLECFYELPLIAILNEFTICMHGGISEGIKCMDDFKKVYKTDGEPKNDIMSDFLWSDPSTNITNYYPSYRGAGHLFDNTVFKGFMNICGFKLLIRSHEHCEDGFSFPFGEDAGIITIFSSIDYCQMGNNAATLYLPNDSNQPIRIDIYTPQNIPYISPHFPKFVLNSICNELSINPLSQSHNNSTLAQMKLVTI